MLSIKNQILIPNVTPYLDIIECDDVTICDVNAVCNDTVGSFQCTCMTGFAGDGFNCYGNLGWFTTKAQLYLYPNYIIDIDECAMGDDICNSTTSVCNNTVGSFDCFCRMGFNMTTDRDCIRKYSLLAGIHIDSFQPKNNYSQFGQISKSSLACFLY